MLGGGSVEGGLPSERCSVSPQRFIVSSETRNLMRQFPEKFAIVIKNEQYMEPMLP